MRALRWLVVTSVALLGCVSGEDFCRSSAVCNEASCESDTDGCTTFEEASELAEMPYSGVHTLTLDSDSDSSATVTALNDGAICRAATCYMRARGRIALEAKPLPSESFRSWSCDVRTEARVELSDLRKNTQCVAQFSAQ